MKNMQTDIQKCSKCGLCMSVCPIYKVTKNDCSVSRGLFMLLNGILAGRLNFNKNVKKYLDLCLKCNACKDFCPTDIDAGKIIQKAKEEYYKAHKNSFLNFCAPYLFVIFMNSVKVCSFLYRFFYFDKILKMFYSFLVKFKFGKFLILMNSTLERGSINYKSRYKNKKIRVIYFKGCVNKYINPKTEKAVRFLLDKLDVEILPIDFTCCGISFLNEGNVDLFLKFAHENLSKIPNSFDYFLTDCATCRHSFDVCENYVKDEEMLKKLKMLNEKSISVEEFVLNNIEKIEFKKDIDFTFHKPCHLKDMELLNKFLSKCSRVNYIEMLDYNTCCGFSGTFALKHQDISKEISKQKAKNALNTNSKNIITTCPACVIGLNQGLTENSVTGLNAKTLVEFIAENIL